MGIVFLVLALRGVDLSEVRLALARADYRPVIVALLSVIATFWVRAARWRHLFYPHHRRLRLAKLVSFIFVGQMMNGLVPGRVGELARAYLVRESEGQSATFTLGTIAVEKAVDISMLAALFILMLPLMALPAWVAEPGWMTMAFLLVVGVIFLALALTRQRWIRWLAGLELRLPYLARWQVSARLERGVASLDALAHWPTLLAVMGWSILLWALYAFHNYLILTALHLPASITMALFVLLVLQVGVAVPSSPGKVGVFQYLCILALSPFGIDRSAGLSYGALLYLVVWVPPLLVGLLCLWWENLSWSRLRQALE